ncbi:hypothetical protein J0A67_05470 [Algoriphagus aestuariicola]|jgi:hypothetical protein|uniref:TerB family tellurite resistance protein n=1 Tax=Algoriphagus aestuariicola TaxID=1852016 RepID=A0ABS3BNB0_9BACT|nr:hypothetical protein [Algoriphagus aestuariicola]MBN7800299.1 hypothetical protein [Algoriphagus aestuariicola]
MKTPTITEGKNAAYHLSGLIYGISLDGVVNRNEFQALKNWCRDYEPLCEMEAFQTLYTEIKPIIDNGQVNSEELTQIRLILGNFLEQFGGRTDSSNLHFLHGLFQGVLASGDVNTYEIYKLRQWLEKNSELKAQAPFDELFELIDRVLEDEKVDDDEAKQLKAFFSKHLV